jgi:hypothetical protein
VIGGGTRGRLGALGRRGLLLAAGASLGAALAVVGGPGPTTGGGPSRSVTGAPFLEGAALTRWCRRVLDARASAEYIGREWWCAGRPGGIWRIEALDVPGACAAAGWSGHDRVVTASALDCAAPAHPVRRAYR